MPPSPHIQNPDVRELRPSMAQRWALVLAHDLGAVHDHAYTMLLSLLVVQAAVQAGTPSASLALVSTVSTLPFLLFIGYAESFTAQAMPRTVLRVAALWEVVIIGLGYGALYSGSFDTMLGVVGLFALRATGLRPTTQHLLQSFLPLPDRLWAQARRERRAGLTLLLGTALGTILAVVWQAQRAWAGGVLLAMALVGVGVSLCLPAVASPGEAPTPQRRLGRELAHGLRRLAQERHLGLAALGLAGFWLSTTLLPMVVLLLGTVSMHLTTLHVGLLVTCLPLGMGLGQLLVGRLAGLPGDLGWLPLGALGMGSSLLLVSTLTSSAVLVALMLGCYGVASVWVCTPLQTLVDTTSPAAERGAIRTATTCLTLSARLLAAGGLWLGCDLIGLSAEHLIALVGLGILLGAVYLLRLLPAFVLRLLCWMLTHTLYRIRVVGAEHLPTHGPALLVCNHVSYVDGLLVAACVQRFIRFLIYRPIYEAPALRWLFRLLHAIPITGGPGAPVALAQAREALQAGHVVCIFAEGSITRTGNLLPFKRGFEQIMAGLQVPIIPMHLDQLWNTPLSFQGARVLGSWPPKFPYPVTVSFAAPLPATATAPQVRQAVLELGSTAMLTRPRATATLPRRFIATAKHRWSALCLADTTSQRWTYGQVLVHSLLLARWLRTRWPQARHLGIYLPLSATAALLHVAVALAGKVPIMLDTEESPDVLQATLRQYAIDLVLTARTSQLMLSLPSAIEAIAIDTHLSDTRWVRRLRRLPVTWLVRWLPTALLQALCTEATSDPDALATLVRTADEAESRQGVMLSHRNILATVEGLQQVLPLQRHDCLLGVLPLSHALGALATLWFPLLSGCGVVYHAAAEARTVGDAVARYRATMLVATPARYAAYLDACPTEALRSLRYAVSGTAPLEASLADAFHAKYGVALVAGYGCAEMAAIVALNIADVQYGSRRQLGSKPGTVGQPLPGVALRVVDPSTGQSVPPQTVGVLWLYGPHRMLGYWGQPEQTAQVFREGWYVTGELASLDDDGFLSLVGQVQP